MRHIQSLVVFCWLAANISAQQTTLMSADARTRAALTALLPPAPCARATSTARATNAAGGPRGAHGARAPWAPLPHTLQDAGRVPPPTRERRHRTALRRGPHTGRAQNPADRGAQRGPGHRARGRAAGPAARHTRPTRARDTCHGALTPAAPGTPRMALRHVGRRRVRGATCAFRCHGAPRGPRRATRGQAETTGPLPTSCSCSTRRQQQARHTAPALRAPACA